ncbi:MAG: carbonic anhydrase [Chloroflexi bacterium]|nr:carbonic anhydrase [Chloroflexota bacterium]
MPDDFLAQSAPIRRDFFENQKELLTKLAHEGQKPSALFIGCADSRVTPEQMLGARPGDLFMLRNIANIIPPYVQTEIGTVSVLEYAVLHLHVPHVIVCGHTDCGGIRGLDVHLDMSKEPALSRWISLARPAQREVDFQMDDLNPEERHVAIVERNVVHQLNNIRSYPFVREALEANQLELHGWVYYLEHRRIGYYDSAADTFSF